MLGLELDVGALQLPSQLGNPVTGDLKPSDFQERALSRSEHPSSGTGNYSRNTAWDNGSRAQTSQTQKGPQKKARVREEATGVMHLQADGRSQRQEARPPPRPPAVGPLPLFSGILGNPCSIPFLQGGCGPV